MHLGLGRLNLIDLNRDQPVLAGGDNQNMLGAGSFAGIFVIALEKKLPTAPLKLAKTCKHMLCLSFVLMACFTLACFNNQFSQDFLNKKRCVTGSMEGNITWERDSRSFLCRTPLVRCPPKNLQQHQLSMMGWPVIGAR